MKRLLIPILIHGCFLFQIQCYSQTVEGTMLLKKDMDLGGIKSWPVLGLFSSLSKDGAYFVYNIVNQPVGSSTLIVRSTKGNWERRIFGIRLGFDRVHFSGDSKKLVYKKKDSLVLVSLGSSSDDKVITNVSQCIFPNSDADNWFIYQSKNPKNETIIHHFNTGKELVLQNVKAFWFKKNSILIKSILDSCNVNLKALKDVDINNGKMTTIWSDTLDCDDMTISKDGLELAFAVNRLLIGNNGKISNKQTEKTIWYFKQGMKAAALKVTSELLNNDCDIVGRPTFMENSNWMVFYLKKKSSIPQPERDSVRVKIWSYKDKIILPDQKRILSRKSQKNYRAAINLLSNQIVSIENDSDVLSYGPIEDYAVIKGDYFVDESWWKLNPPHPTILMSLKDGKRIILKNDNTSLSNFSSSPDGNWLIYYDSKNLNFFSCNLKTGKILNITKSIPTSFQNASALEGSNSPVFGVVAWISEDNSLVLYDNYDIWRIDPAGIRKAINITNGYGKKYKLKLRLVYSNEVNLGINKNIIYPSDTLLIVAFSPENKSNGFFRKVLNENGNPEKLIMGSYTFYRTESQKPHSFSLSNGMQPIKADSANIWVVSRETTGESKNYFITEDFKQFHPLTNLYPEKQYNWLTAELVNWKQLDGTMSQGILYKPENFDSTKKYPLLITYYEKMSHRLYEFPEPEFSTGDINIPWFVTHGYLVFTPDIHYSIASISGRTTGDCALNSVVSAAKFLSKRSYVDKAKMGIEGHSFGGGQTNFIITHTNLFAAACEFAGDADAISAYLTLVPAFAPYEHFAKQGLAESGQGRTGASLWERPDLYLKQSAVLSANKVTTPLLIVHNESDNNISFRQGIELYMALRRLGKKVWMLQYDDGHNLHEEKNAIDFTIRLTQYFDHYLKDAPASIWLTNGIPVDQIGMKTAYQFDPAGNCGKNCKICKYWNEKFKKDSAACWKEIEQKTKGEHWMASGEAGGH